MTDIFTGKICSYYKDVVNHITDSFGKNTAQLITPGCNVSILEMLTNERYTNHKLLTELRQSGYKSDFYKKNKKRLSAASLSSVQDNLTIDRSDDNHLFHTGLITFDIDPDANPMLLHGGSDEMKDFIISKIPYVCYLGKSVSDIGFWGIFAIKYKDEHYAHYEAMKKYFSDRSITIDTTSDISRLRFIAYDPDAHFELDPEIFADTLLINKDTPHIEDYYRSTPPHEFFMAACRWVEAKHDMQFQVGSVHNYLLRLYATLRYAHVSREDCLNWIYGNLINPDNVTTNCLDEINIKH